VAEGQTFEKFERREIPSRPETGSEVDIESVLERGEIESAETLEGYFPFKKVEIKDDGKGIFRPDGFMYERLEKKEDLRTEFELLAFSIDKILGFGLVPPTVFREVGGQKGTLQMFIENGKIAGSYGRNWPEAVNEQDIFRAAVFDLLINAQDRHEGNFLVDPVSKKIWLIDHDYLMFLVKGIPSCILTEAVKRSLTELSEEVVGSVQRLYGELDYLVSTSNDPRIQEILLGIKIRAGTLLENRKIIV